MDEKVMNGQCLCGAVKVSATPARETLTACHCDMCRKMCSGPFIAIEAALGTLTVDGPVKRLQTSEWAERAFCEDCGSTLWYHMTEEGRAYHLSAGLFETGDMPINMEVWIDEKPSGYSFAGERKQLTGAEIIAALGVE